jgi:zeaxanthin glucosyltransferase
VGFNKSNQARGVRPEGRCARALTKSHDMKLGFICLNLPGHLNPMTTLARQLQARGHEVVFLYSSSAAGLPCIPSEESDYFNESRSEVSKRQGEDALALGLGQVLRQTEGILHSMPEMVERSGVDALLIDTVQFYAELAPMRLGIPYINVALALHFDYSGYTPFCVCGDPHERTPEAIQRNREVVANFVPKLSNDGIKAYAWKSGLQVDWDNPASTMSKLAWISQTPEEFDFESSQWLPQFHRTGPFHDGKGREPVDFPWDRLTGEPLIYASMGTILNGQPEVFRTIAAAVAKHKEVQLVLSIGDQLEPEQIGPVPGNAIVVKRAPQLELLKLAEVCITHAGLNTVLESLAQGVPQLAIPVTFDQPGVAARVAAKKTGMVTSLDKLGTSHLSSLLGEVLNDPVYGRNARKIQKAITRTNGLSLAADLVEQSFGVTRNEPRDSATPVNFVAG